MCSAKIAICKYMARVIANRFRSIRSSSKGVAYSIEHHFIK